MTTRAPSAIGVTSANERPGGSAKNPLITSESLPGTVSLFTLLTTTRDFGLVPNTWPASSVVQTSTSSQLPSLSESGKVPFGGQTVLAPSQSAAISQASAAARHSSPALPAG